MQKVFRWCDDFNHPTWCYVSFYLKWRYRKTQKLKCLGISEIRTKTTPAKMSGSVINFALTSSSLEKENNTTVLERRRKGVPKRLPTTFTGTGKYILQSDHYEYHWCMHGRWKTSNQQGTTRIRLTLIFPNQSYPLLSVVHSVDKKKAGTEKRMAYDVWKHH